MTNHYISDRSLVLRTDEHGLRKGASGSSADARTVLFVGDSITLADYLEDGLTIPDLVQEVAATEKFAVKSINAGIATAGLARELEILREVLAKQKPDLVLVNFFLNDVRNCCASHSVTLPLPWRRSSFISHLFEAVQRAWNPVINFEPGLSPQQLGSWQASADRRLNGADTDPEFRKKVLERFLGWGNAWSDEAWERMNTIIEEIDAEVRRAGVKLAFVAYPVTYQITTKRADDFPQRELGRILQAHGVPMLDLLPMLREHYRRTNTLPYFDEAHPPEVGNRLIAQSIVDFVEREKLLGRRVP